MGFSLLGEITVRLAHRISDRSIYLVRLTVEDPEAGDVG